MKTTHPYNSIATYLFKNNVTLYFSNKIKTIDHINLTFRDSYSSGNNIQRNKATVMILVKRGKNRLVVKKVQCARKFWVIFIDTLYEKGSS